MESLVVTTVLSLLHLFLASTSAIIAFSLLVYIVTHTPRNTATLSFVMLAALVALMWVGEAGHVSVRVESAAAVEEATFWLRVQAVGLALLPAGPAPDSSVVPHPTRFVAMTGITRRGVETVVEWIRPSRAKAAAHG